MRCAKPWALCALACSVVWTGCASDPGLRQARDTVKLGNRVVEEADAAPIGPDVDAAARRRLQASVQRAQHRLDDAGQTVDIWQQTGGGGLAWETVAPCLASALQTMSAALRGAGIDPPPELDQAITMARAASSRSCRQ